MRAAPPAYVRKKSGEPGRKAVTEMSDDEPSGSDRLHEDRQEIRFGSWNIGSMTGRSEEVAEVMGRRRIDICCLQETRWKGSGTRMIGRDRVKYKFFWQGGGDGTGGAGVLVAEGLVENVVEVKRRSDRIVQVKVVVGKEVVNVVSAYAPQTGRGEDEKEEFWRMMEEVVAVVGDAERLVIGGDMNAHVGEKADGYEGVHGGVGFGERNEEGVGLLDFACAADLTVANTRFQREERRRPTYESGGNKTVVDYFLVPSREMARVRNVKVISGEECVSQHKLLVMDWKVMGRRPARRRWRPKLRLWLLKKAEMRERLRSRLEMAAKARGEGELQENWVALRDAVRGAASEVCGQTRGQARHKETWWWCEEVRDAVERKRAAFVRWRKSGMDEDRVLYRAAKREARKRVSEAKGRECREWADALRGPDGKRRVFAVARRIARERRDVLGGRCVKNGLGEVVVEEGAVKEVWAKYMGTLLNEENGWDGQVEAAMVEGPEMDVGMEEVSEALDGMKKGKAAGLTGVVAEMLLAGGDDFRGWVAEVCRQVWRQGEIPADWQASVVVPVYKSRGDPLVCGSYRPVKLLEHGMKVMERILERRLRRVVSVDSMQCGFMPGRSTTEAVFVVRQLQEKYLEKAKSLWFAFVDLEKAYDRVPREVIRWALRRKGVTEELVRAVMALYVGAKSVVRTAVGDSRAFDVGVGLHQGSVLSPLLFVVVMDEVVRAVKVGMPWEVLFADDLVLVAESREALVERFRLWKAAMEGKGLRVNVSKTKVMESARGLSGESMRGRWPCAVCRTGVGVNSVLCSSCGKWVHAKCSGMGRRVKRQADFVCRVCAGNGGGQSVVSETVVEVGDGVGLEKVKSFRYLGDVLDCAGDVGAAVTARIRCGWGKWRELAPILLRKDVSLELKGLLYRVCVRSAMLYSSETWALRVEDVKRIEGAEMRMLRWMGGFSWADRRKNSEVRAMMDIVPVEEVMRMRRLRWYGHVERKNDEDGVKRAMDLEVEGKRPRGRPRKTWKATVEEDMKVRGLTREMAHDRARWKSAMKLKPANPS